MTLVRALDARWAVGGTLGVVPLPVLGPCGTWRTFLRVVRLSPWVPPCVDFRRCIFAYAGLVRGGGGIASAWPRPYHAAIGGICSPTAVRVSPLAFHHDPLLIVGCFRSGIFWILSYLVMLEMLQAHSAHGGDIYIYIYLYFILYLLVGCAYFSVGFSRLAGLGVAPVDRGCCSHQAITLATQAGWDASCRTGTASRGCPRPTRLFTGFPCGPLHSGRTVHRRVCTFPGRTRRFFTEIA